MRRTLFIACVFAMPLAGALFPTEMTAMAATPIADGGVDAAAKSNCTLSVSGAMTGSGSCEVGTYLSMSATSYHWTVVFVLPSWFPSYPSSLHIAPTGLPENPTVGTTTSSVYATASKDGLDWMADRSAVPVQGSSKLRFTTAKVHRDGVARDLEVHGTLDVRLVAQGTVDGGSLPDISVHLTF